MGGEWSKEGTLRQLLFLPNEKFLLEGGGLYFRIFENRSRLVQTHLYRTKMGEKEGPIFRLVLSSGPPGSVAKLQFHLI